MAVGWRASSSVVLLSGWLAVPALADDRPATMAVAAFPDVAPERPKALPSTDPALELLATNPYESALMAHKIAMNLYGEDPAFEDPYADDRRLANPYTEDLRLASPYSSRERIDNPYSSTLLLLDDPYASMRRR